MKTLPITLLSTTLLTFGGLMASPTEATTLSHLTYSGEVSLNSFFFREPLTRPINASFTVDDLSRRLSDEGDSQLTVPYLGFVAPLVQDYPLLNSPDLSLFMGIGNIFSDVEQKNWLSSFVWEYDKTLDILVIDDYDFNQIQGCLTNTCYLQGEGSVMADYISADLSFFLTQTVNTVNGSTTIVDPSPANSVPEPTMLLGLLGTGTWFLTKGRIRNKI